MAKKVHIVPHMHWDREWYFTTEESRILLLNNMEEILSKLENEKDYKYYILDGQTCILEDFFEIKPNEKERIKKLVKAGKLIIGPWYTQTDEMIVSGESIVRNMFYGINDSKEFGAYMDIGYLPDSFGQSGQLPQILNGFGIDKVIFWRGVSERHGTKKIEFFWEGNGNSKVLAHIMPLGYAIGKYLPADKEALKKRIDGYFEVLERGAVGDNILLPNGHDQMPIQKNIFEIIDMLKEIYPDKEFFLSNYNNLFEEFKKDASKYDTLKGEFIDGKYMRVHRSIYSTRMDIKNIHAKLEHKLVNILEPLAVIAYSLGFEYYTTLIEKIWKTMLKNHAHDSIGCCCSDKVHKEIMYRFFIAEDMMDNLIEFYKRKIVDAIDSKNNLDRITLFNTLPYTRTSVIKTSIITKLKEFSIVDENGNEIEFGITDKSIIDSGLIDRQLVHYENYDPFNKYEIEFIGENIPALGYKTYYVSDKKSNKIKSNEVNKNKTFIENEFYKIDVNDNGSINIFSKELNERFENVLIFEDGEDDGDEYNYSPTNNDFIIYSSNSKSNYKIINSAYSQKLNIDIEMNIPKDIESRHKKITDSILKINAAIELNKYSKTININLEIENNSCDHRVRVLIPSKISSLFSFADNQYGTVKRAVVDDAINVWEKEDWKEAPVSIYPMLSFVSLNNESKGVSIVTNGMREYQIIGDDFSTIALTLFRSIGVIGKEELSLRPGRPSGIKMPTPDSQMIGKLKLDFGIIMHKGNYIKASISKYAKEYSSSITAYNKIPYNAMKLNASEFNTPENYSLLEIEGDLTVGAIKKSEYKDGIILRVFNPSDENNASAKILIQNKKEVHYCNLLEEEKEKINTQKNDKHIIIPINNVNPCEMKTILIK